MTENPDPQERFEIDWTRAIAGSLAAVASAVLLSTLGAAGTVLGAAIGSLVVTISSAMFAQGLSSSKRTLARKQMAAEKVDSAQAEVLRASRVDDPAAQASHLDQADEHLADAREQLDEAIEMTSSVSLRERVSRLPWKRMALTALTLFVVSLVLITAFELRRRAQRLVHHRRIRLLRRHHHRPGRRRRQPGPSGPADGIHQPERNGGGVRPANPERFALGDSAAVAFRLDGPHRGTDDDSLGDPRADLCADDNALTSRNVPLVEPVLPHHATASAARPATEGPRRHARRHHQSVVTVGS